VGSQVIELNTAQSQTAGDDAKWIQWSARKPGLKCCAANGRRCWRSASSIGNRVASVRRLELEIELERIVFTKVRRETTVFETVVENAKPAASDKFGANLISKTKARRNVGLRGV